MYLFCFQSGIVLADSFMSSFYYIYMSDLYKTFDKHNIMPVLTSEYINDMSHVLNSVVSFLDLSK